MENLTSQNVHWSDYKKIAFRFSFIFFGFFIITSNNGAYPFWNETVGRFLEASLQIFIPWIGKHVLHLSYDITIFTNGSGDTTYDYVIVFTIALVAVLGAIISTALDRKRTNYNVLYYWLTAAMRFYVGLMLFHYGMVKVVKLQFPSPDIYRLTEPIGDLSPMGLAWTFLGFSDGYNFFMGIAEIAALLLLFRRTMTVGAIITLMTASNVMAVNYFYDVPVKILSTALVIMTLFLLLNNAGRLFRFFFVGQTTSLAIIKSPILKKRWMYTSKMVFKFLVIGYAVVYGTITVWKYKNELKDSRPKPKLYGLYDIDIFIVNNDTLPNSSLDASRWNQLVFEDNDYMRVRFKSDSVAGFLAKVDTIHQKIDIKYRADSTMRGTLHYTFSNPDNFILSGTIRNDSVTIISKRRKIETKNFRLIKRGFHWINERPYNK